MCLGGWLLSRALDRGWGRIRETFHGLWMIITIRWDGKRERIASVHA